MAKANSISSSAPKDIREVADGISCTISILRDLLKLGLQEYPESFEDGKGASAIRAAFRYVDDITTLNEKLFDLAASAKGGA
jgi:hypothetical protein